MQGLENVNWLGHAGFKLTLGSKLLFIDPYQIETDEKADILLITHSHYDHYSISDIQKIVKDDTIIFMPADCTSKLSGKVGGGRTQLVEPNKEYSVDDIKIKTVAAYNSNKSFHPKDNAWVGYIIEFDGSRYYHAGDSDVIPEIAHLQNLTVAFLPVSGTYTMDAKEAATLALHLKPKIAIPMHFGSVVGDESDAKAFKNVVERSGNQTTVIIPQKNS
ncbi:MBL fold metallo-hydrolase [Candidatus Woesearchaeota archaeon]|nr:MBL fold metallo-hydrolase [Candidatus Woesearchaeota archaeon]